MSKSEIETQPKSPEFTALIDSFSSIDSLTEITDRRRGESNSRIMGQNEMLAIEAFSLNPDVDIKPDTYDSIAGPWEAKKVLSIEIGSQRGEFGVVDILDLSDKPVEEEDGKPVRVIKVGKLDSMKMDSNYALHLRTVNSAGDLVSKHLIPLHRGELLEVGSGAGNVGGRLGELPDSVARKQFSIGIADDGRLVIENHKQDGAKYKDLKTAISALRPGDHGVESFNEDQGKMYIKCDPEIKYPSSSEQQIEPDPEPSPRRPDGDMAATRAIDPATGEAVSGPTLDNYSANMAGVRKPLDIDPVTGETLRSPITHNYSANMVGRRKPPTESRRTKIVQEKSRQIPR